MAGSDYHYVKEIPTRQVLEEVRSQNRGKPRQEYCRYRSTWWVQGYRRTLIPGAEDDIARAALLAAQEFGGRVVKVSASEYSLQIEFICPTAVSVHRANVLLRRATSRAVRAKHPGLGSPTPKEGSGGGYLWRSNTITETIPVLLEQPRKFETI